VDKITCESGHGTQTLQQAFRNSCNCAFGQIAIQVGAENMQKYADAFGMTEGVAFDGITTAAGNYDVLGTADASLAWSGIGQYTDQVNPCAFLTFMGAVASGGKGVSPYLVEEITIGNNTTYQADTEQRTRIMSAETAEKLSSYLRANVTERYGDWNFPELSVCAKTGTGEVGDGIKPNAMLAGYVQNEEYPLAFIVFVENAGYGANVCIPIATSVLETCKTIL
jgi:peptidoglycan glycosyltransferase